MCGICGVFRFSGTVDEESLSAMRDTMIHRGPDGAGLHISPDKKAGLAHRRLKIIDLSENARQPLANEEGTIWLVCNGEIYNYRELRDELVKKGHTFKSHADIEVIIHLYEDCGMDLLKKIDGDFAFGLWDQVQNRLYVARDPLGIKPCYYYRDSRVFIFASEIKSILRDPSVPKAQDPVALHHYLTLLSIPEPYTIYQNIRKLAPGHVLQIQGQSLAKTDYVQLGDIFSQPLTRKKERDYLEEFAGLLKKAVQKRLMSDVPLGVYLSGGTDSSSIVALMSELGTPIKSFSVIFGDQYLCDESRYSRLVAKIFGTEHDELIIGPDAFMKLPEIIRFFDEPFAVPSAVPLYFLSRSASRLVKVVLTGDGGDELLAGYARYSWDRRAARLHKLGAGPLSRVFSTALAKIPSGGLPYLASKGKDLLQKWADSVSLEPDERYLSFFTPLSEEAKRELYSDEMARDIADARTVGIFQTHYKNLRTSDPLNTRIYGDLKTTLADEMLTKGDRMAMAHSIENRVPLLDQELVGFSARLPGNLKLNGTTGKFILKKAMSSKLPRAILFRRKGGFNVPLGAWLRNEMSGLVRDYLNDSRIKKGGIFNDRKVRSLLSRFNERRANLEYQIFPLLVYEIWRAECFENKR